jgi:high-affinity iron transporter
MRRLIVAVLLLVGLLAAAAPVSAAQPTDSLTELQAARDLIAQSVTLYDAGQATDALSAARSAYLDHFEQVELALRVHDDGLTLQLEEDFANVRSLIQGGAPAENLRAAVVTLDSGLDDAERTLTAPGLAAPLIAALYAFTILFREGIEMVLVVAFVLSSLAATRELRQRRPVLQGVAAGIGASVLAFVGLSVLLDVAPVQRELLEAVMTVLAVILLFYVSFWLLARLDQRRWREFVRSNVTVAVGTGSTFALFAVGFTSVFREGVETALFYQALLAFAQGLEVWVAAGALVALGALVVVAWLVFKAGRRIPVKQVLGVAVVMLMILSVAMVGNAVRSLQDLGVIPLTIIAPLPSLPLFLSELTGWHPTLETIVGQVALATVYIAGALWALRHLPARLAHLRSGGRTSRAA